LYSATSLVHKWKLFCRGEESSAYTMGRRGQPQNTPEAVLSLLRICRAKSGRKPLSILAAIPLHPYIDLPSDPVCLKASGAVWRTGAISRNRPFMCCTWKYCQLRWRKNDLQWLLSFHLQIKRNLYFKLAGLPPVAKLLLTLHKSRLVLCMYLTDSSQHFLWALQILVATLNLSDHRQWMILGPSIGIHHIWWTAEKAVIGLYEITCSYLHVYVHWPAVHKFSSNLVSDARGPGRKLYCRPLYNEYPPFVPHHTGWSIASWVWSKPRFYDTHHISNELHRFNGVWYIMRLFETCSREGWGFWLQFGARTSGPQLECAHIIQVGSRQLVSSAAPPPLQTTNAYSLLPLWKCNQLW
jgi:hypothetical protein